MTTTGLRVGTCKHATTYFHDDLSQSLFHPESNSQGRGRKFTLVWLIEFGQNFLVVFPKLWCSPTESARSG